VPAPDAARRGALLASLLRKLGTAPRTARAAGREAGPLTEGCLPRDLRAVAARALHAQRSRALRSRQRRAGSRASDGTGSGTGEDAAQGEGPAVGDVLSALRGFVASNLRAANLDGGGGGTSSDGGGACAWNALGGLAGPQRELQEMLDLPTRYAPLFNSVRTPTAPA
jgi:hypothetical protein